MDLDAIISEAKQQINAAQDVNILDAVRVDFMGKKRAND
jgi:phenylalanyl-tRNA synthetase alpha chain